MTSALARARARHALLGVPFIPPQASATLLRAADAAGRRFRSAVVPPQRQLLEAVFGFVDTRVLGALVRHGVPDALSGPPRTTAELAASVGLREEALARLLRHAHARGFVRRDLRGLAFVLLHVGTGRNSWLRRRRSSVCRNELADERRVRHPVARIAGGCVEMISDLLA